MLNEQLTEEFEIALDCADRMFSMLAPEAILERPIPLRQPNIFYYGHLPAFAWNQIFRYALQFESFNSRFDKLFERGIDPPDDTPEVKLRSSECWPEVVEISSYRKIVEQHIFDLLADCDLANEAHRELRHAVCMTLEHYLMHIETFLYMQHQLAPELKQKLDSMVEPRFAPPDKSFSMVEVPGGLVTIGVGRGGAEFRWCNEFDATPIAVDGFSMDRYNVTNAQFLEFVSAGGYTQRELWTDAGWRWISSAGIEHPHFWKKQGRSWLLHEMFGDIPLPDCWPVYVTHAEAEAYCRWKKASLPTEAEFHRAAYGTASNHERAYPWGNQLADGAQANFGMQMLSLTSVGSAPTTASYWGIEDLVGNGWEWTSTIFKPFDGFRPLKTYPGYSADFFDGKHYVLKGASPLTAARLIRKSFRNWFQPQYPYVYATFRCVKREQ